MVLPGFGRTFILLFALAVLVSDAFACRGLEFESVVFLKVPPPALERLNRYGDRLVEFRAKVIELLPDPRGPFTARIDVTEVLSGKLALGPHTLVAPNSDCDHGLQRSMAGYVVGIIEDDNTVTAVSIMRRELFHD